MQFKTSHLVAGAIVLVVLLFLVVAGLMHKPKPKPAPAASRTELPLVTAPVIQETQRPYSLVIRGHTEANRTVVVRAETAGPVAATPAREGSFVGKGAVLCRLAVDARQASLDQAKANLRSRQLQREAS